MRSISFLPHRDGLWWTLLPKVETAGRSIDEDNFSTKSTNTNVYGVSQSPREDPSAGPEAQASGRELGAHIEWALAQLPSRQREAFLLREWEQLSVEETALAMVCGAGSVKVHHFRALRRLRTLLADRFEEDS